MRLRYILLAEKVILELDDKSATAVELLDSFELDLQVPEGKGLPPVVGIPRPAVLLCVWEPESEDEKHAIHDVDLVIRLTKGRTEPQPFTVNFEGRQKCYSRMKMASLPFDGYGDYQFEVTYQSAGEPRTSSWNLRIDPPGELRPSIPQPVDSGPG